MKTRVALLAALLGLFSLVLSACSNSDLLSADRDNIVYVADADASFDAVRAVISRMRWQIHRVDETQPDRIYLNGSTFGTGSSRGGPSGSRKYTFQIGMIFEDQHTTRIQLVMNIQDYGSSRPQQVRRQFFQYLEAEGLTPVPSSSSQR